MLRLVVTDWLFRKGHGAEMSYNRYDMLSRKGLVMRSNAKLLFVSKSSYGGDWHSVPHTHAFAELFFVARGGGRFQIEDKLYPVAPGDMVFVNPNVEHTETSLNVEPLEYVVLAAEGLQLSAEEGQDGRFCIFHLADRRREIQLYLHTMLQEIEQKPPGYEIVCQNLLETMIIQLMRRMDFPVTAFTTPARHTKRVCVVVKRYIDEHYKESLTLDALAEIAHVNKYHLAHSFMKENGIPPMKYLLVRRIEESRHLLESTDYTLSQIARILGFSSASYFSQSFQRLEHISPREYRRARTGD